MIDYDKLKMAHELIEKIHLGKLHMQYSLHDGVEHIFSMPFQEAYYTSSIDDLIDKLQSLLKPEPKYKAGDEVFILHWNAIEHATVVALSSKNNNRYQIMLDGEGQLSRTEDDLFPTREALIEHQIAHWSSMQDKCEHGVIYKNCGACDEPHIHSNQSQVDVDGCQHKPLYDDKGTTPKVNVCKFCFEEYAPECQHERGNNLYTESGYKCIKCGEFYR